MITHIHSAAVVVSDQDRALEFYTNVLGWEKDIDQPMGEGLRFVTVKPRDGQTALALNAPEMHGGAQPGTTVSGISLIADDVQRTYEELSAKGVNFTMKPERMPWGDMAPSSSIRTAIRSISTAPPPRNRSSSPSPIQGRAAIACQPCALVGRRAQPPIASHHVSRCRSM